LEVISQRLLLAFSRRKYGRTFSKDPLWLRLAVAIIYVLDVTHTVLSWKAVYFYTIEGPCDPIALDTSSSELIIAIFFVASIDLIAESIYCFRVYKILDSAIIALVCFLLALARFTVYVYLGVYLYVDGRPAGLSESLQSSRFRTGMLVTSSLAVFTEMSICACISYGLWKRRTGFSETDKLVDRIIAYAVGSGFLPAAIEAAKVADYLVQRRDLVWLGIWFTIPRALSCSLLASLNQRTVTTTRNTPGTTAISTGRDFTFERTEQATTFSVELVDATPSEAGQQIRLSRAWEKDTAKGF